jgi:PadR family transcriptional regulator PadR
MTAMPDDPMDLLQGTLDVLVLRALSGGARHGYAVSRWIHEQTDTVLRVNDAPLYKALHRLEHDGCVEAEWGQSANHRRARFYRLTPKGRRRLRAEQAALTRYMAAVSKAFEAD